MVPTRRKANQPSAKIALWVNDLESFRRWSDHRDFPEIGHISYYDGAVHVDMSKEQLFSHGQIKLVTSITLGGLVTTEKRGRIWFDSAYVTNEAADISNKPDGVFVAHKSLAARRVSYGEGRESGFVELIGSPDWVLEIVSDSSVQKDKFRLKELYWKAGIGEYWLIDARGGAIEFEIYRHAPKGYVAARRLGGWLKSNVFGKSFRLSQQTAADGQPEYALEMQ